MFSALAPPSRILATLSNYAHLATYGAGGSIEPRDQNPMTDIRVQRSDSCVILSNTESDACQKQVAEL